MGGTHPNQERDGEYPPLYDAIMVGNIEGMQLLLTHGACLDYFIHNTETCYQYAMKIGSEEVKAYLRSLPINHVEMMAMQRDVKLPEKTNQIKRDLDDAVAKNDLEMAKNILTTYWLRTGDLRGFSHYCSPRQAAAGSRKMVIITLLNFSKKRAETPHLNFSIFCIRLS